MTKKSKFSLPKVVPLEDYAASKIDLWIPTGLDPLDMIVNPAGGGIPAGRITVIYGEESSGKSTLLAHIFKSCQDLGIEAYLCDAENTFSVDFASRVGLDPAQLGVIQVRTIEDLDEFFHKSIAKFYDKNGSDTPLVVGIDSIEALDVENFLKKRKRQVGDRARAWGPFWRSVADLQRQYRHLTIIALNQVRTNIKTSQFEVGPDETAPGGRALRFYASLEIKLKHRKTLTNPNKGYAAYATVVEAKIAKSKIGAPFRKCLIYNRFSKGFDNPRSILFFLAMNDVLKKQPGKTTVWTSEWFSLEAKIGGRKRSASKITLKQAKAFVKKYTWEALSEPVRKEWLK